MACTELSSMQGVAAPWNAGLTSQRRSCSSVDRPGWGAASAALFCGAARTAQPCCRSCVPARQAFVGRRAAARVPAVPLPAAAAAGLLLLLPARIQLAVIEIMIRGAREIEREKEGLAQGAVWGLCSIPAELRGRPDAFKTYIEMRWGSMQYRSVAHEAGKWWGPPFCATSALSNISFNLSFKDHSTDLR